MKQIKTYNKLVRDRIPQIIEAGGGSCTTEILDEKAYAAMLDAKLGEELGEFLESHAAEELADLLEVMRAAARLHGWQWEQIEAIRREKHALRGGFDERILLKEVANP